MENDVQAGLKEKVQKALESIRPYLVSDGGDVRLHDITDEGIVEVELLGSCESCGMNSMTLKAGVEEAIKRVAPEIKGVRAINGIL
jgi:Fe-S cluster biogenesis protein NfuA